MYAINIKQAEQLTGITSKNIRFYEDAGLLHPQRNAQNGYRKYADEDIRRIKLIKMLRKLNMPVETIREVLDGEQQLDAVMAEQYEKLEQSIRQLEAAKQICKALGNEQAGIVGLDVDGYLDRIDTLESQGEWFNDIIDDFKQVVTALEKRKITFYPDEIILTPREFTDALLKYADDYGRDITITKESMSPEFTLDGLPYMAQRVNGSYGSRIYANIVDSSLLNTPDVPPERRRWMEIAWKYVLPAFIWGTLILFFFRQAIFLPHK